MNIAKMHYYWKLKYNKINSNHKKDFTPYEIDSTINMASNTLFEILYSGNNLKQYNLGFEVTAQRLDMLSPFLKCECLPVEMIDTCQYQLKFSELEFPYAHLIRAYIKYDCVDENGEQKCKVMNIAMEQHDDLNIVLNDEFRKPDKKWNRLVGTIKDSSLIIYSDDYIVKEVCIEYLKCPDEVYFGVFPNGSLKYDGYDTLEYLTEGIGYKKGDERVNSDWPEKYHNLLIDMAVLEVSRSLEDVNTYQLRQDVVNQVIR